MFQTLEIACSIDFRSLNNGVRNVLNLRDINNHHVAGQLPYDKNQQSPKAGFRVRKPVCEKFPTGGFGDCAEGLDKNKLPGKAKKNAADQIWHEECAAHKGCALCFGCHQQGKQKANDINPDDCRKGEYGGKCKCVEEILILRENFHVVLDANKMYLFADAIPVC